jgi:hypothetical protein
MIGTHQCEQLHEENLQFGYLPSFCTRSTRMSAIPQGFRRRFVRGRSQPMSANPVSRSESGNFSSLQPLPTTPGEFDLYYDV